MRIKLTQANTRMFCRVEGPTGTVREVPAVVDHNFEYCMLFSRNAADIGYLEGTYRPGDWQKIHPDRIG